MKLAFKKVTWVVIVVMIGLLGLTAAAVAGDIVWPWSSEPGFEPQSLSDTGAAGNPIDEGRTGIGEPAQQIGVGEPSADGQSITGLAQLEGVELQPDDSGYTGAITESNQVDIAPSGEIPAEEVDWDSLIPEGSPDQVETDADPNWTVPYYYNVAGSALRPRDSSVEWATGPNGGCLYQATGSNYSIYNIHLEIPDGARIEFLRLYFYDANSSYSTAFLTRYNGAGGIVDITTVSSEGDSGYGSTLSAEMAHIVDNVNNSYVLNWRPNLNGSTMQLCGLRVAYRLP